MLRMPALRIPVLRVSVPPILAALAAMALLAAGCTTVDPYTGRERIDPVRTGAAVVGAAALGALVYHVADDDDDHRHRGHRRYAYGRAFSPARDVVCYPAQRRCYNDGDYSRRWTRRVF